MTVLVLHIIGLNGIVTLGSPVLDNAMGSPSYASNIKKCLCCKHVFVADKIICKFYICQFERCICCVFRPPDRAIRFSYSQCLV